MVTSYTPDYGDVVWVFLDPIIGHEQFDRQPAIVISQKDFSTHTSLAIICPITSKSKGLPFEIIYNGNSVKGAVLPIHAKSLDWVARKVKFIEKAPKELTDTVAESVGAIIGLD